MAKRTSPSNQTIRSFQEEMHAHAMATIETSVWNRETTDQLLKIAAYIRSQPRMNHNQALVIDEIVRRREEIAA